ncbi:hypothetical protein B0H15DRAFT_957958 [Mycena belliarum]|uniref:Uncharacterized protein n=1 Tax=Mycena belliarum TaxID=1033014 RepID=A0AAD6TND0_9AGAR|nr:hypothetical protein B0H15DRAFT_957958 [Mycena belliae]
MRQGQFTVAQRLHIESYFPDFASLLQTGLSGSQLTAWKQKTASDILDSPQLEDLDMSQHSRKAWFEMIVRKFTNYRNQVYRKQNPVSSTTSPTPHSPLFAKENGAALNSAAAQRVTSTGHGSLVAAYQLALKERWDGLSDVEKTHWDDLAAAGTGDIENNQAEFAQKMHGTMKDFCQGGLLGDTELVLFYAFRKPSSGDLDIMYSIHGHSRHNQVNFGGSRSELQATYGVPWAKFAEEVIPRPMVSDSSVIPRNAFGIPVFPSIDLNAVTPDATRLLLAEYWLHVWAHAWRFDPNHPPIPWAQISSNPARYYNTERFSLPQPMAAPQTLNTLQTTIWAEYLVRTSSLYDASPFVLYPHECFPENPSAVTNDQVSTSSVTAAPDDKIGDDGSTRGSSVPRSDNGMGSGVDRINATIFQGEDDGSINRGSSLPPSERDANEGLILFNTDGGNTNDAKGFNQPNIGPVLSPSTPSSGDPDRSNPIIDLSNPITVDDRREGNPNQGLKHHLPDAGDADAAPAQGAGKRRRTRASKGQEMDDGCNSDNAGRPTLRKSLRQKPRVNTTPPASRRRPGNKPTRRKRTVGYLYSDEDSDAFQGA